MSPHREGTRGQPGRSKTISSHHLAHRFRFPPAALKDALYCDVSCFISNHHNCAGAFVQERGSRKAGSLHKLCNGLPGAATEALEGRVRSRLGQKLCESLPVAATEALEGTVRPRLGQKLCHGLPAAVTEALEGRVRS